MADDLLKREAELHEAGRVMLANSGILPLLQTLGTVIPRGSFTTGLMTYPDMDFAIQNNTPNIHDARKLIPKLFDEIKVSELKLTDFSKNKHEGAAYFLGFRIVYKHLEWWIAATVGLPGPLDSEVDEWLAKMTPEQRLSILELKSELLAAGRYGSSKAVPPYTFRAVQLYEGVLQGGAKTIEELDVYFRNRAIT